MSIRKNPSRISPIMRAIQNRQSRFQRNYSVQSFPKSTLLKNKDDPWDTFLDRTSIPALSHMPETQQILGKLMWFALFVIGIIIAITQSKSLINEFVRFAVIQTNSITVENSLPFPAVTICSNSPIKWPKDTSDLLEVFPPEIVERINNITHGDQLYLKNRMPYEREEVELLNILSDVDEKTRLKGGINMTDFKIACWWENSKCNESQFLYFNNLYWGNCFTFNDGIVHEKRMISKLKSELTLILNLHGENWFPYRHRKHGAIMSIHPPGRAPVMDKLKVFPLYSGKFTHIGLKQTRIKRLPHPYPSKCLDISESDKLSHLSVYSTKERKYRYSQEDCIENCQKAWTLDHCNCVDPVLPLEPSEFACDMDYCSSYTVPEEEIKCACPLPCRQTIYSFTQSAEEGFLRRVSWKSYFAHHDIELETEEQIQHQEHNIIGVSVRWDSMVLHTIQEEQKFKIPDLLGSIGGNLGLWAGFTFVAVIELLLMIINVIFKWCWRNNSQEMKNNQRDFRVRKIIRPIRN